MLLAETPTSVAILCLAARRAIGGSVLMNADDLRAMELSDDAAAMTAEGLGGCLADGLHGLANIGTVNEAEPES
jgi:hypothetical protein